MPWVQKTFASTRGAPSRILGAKMAGPTATAARAILRGSAPNCGRWVDARGASSRDYAGRGRRHGKRRQGNRLRK